MTQPPPKTDGQLLAQFSSDHSQAAFAELVNRHGTMVHGVALRVLADHHEAQDVMQAVFLVLARKASALRRSESVGGWLHTVAWRLAMNAQQSRRSRQQRETTAMREQPSATAAADPAAGLFKAELDAALSDLPERYRQPVVLFHLEAKSLEETAQRLGLNLKTAGTRLTRARELLRKKLVRRGVTVGSVGALIALFSAEAGAAVLPATIVASTVSAATGGTVSTTVAALSKGALHAMFIAKVKTVGLAAAACLVVAGTGVVTAKQLAGSSTPAPSAPKAAPPVATPVRVADQPVQFTGADNGKTMAAQQGGAPKQTSSWVTKPNGQVDINPTWGAFDRLDQSGELVIIAQAPAGQSGYRPPPVELRLKIANGREEIVRKAAAGLAKGAKVKVGCVWSTANRERFVWELAAMESR